MFENLQAVGLLYDATGIIILGVPAAFRMVSEVKAHSETHWNWNKPFGKALCVSRVDITVGSLLLLAGFAIQFFGAIGASWSYETGILVTSVCGAILVFYFLLIRRVLANLLFKKVMRAHDRD